MTIFRRPRWLLCQAFVFLGSLFLRQVEAQQVVYNNTAHALNYRISEKTEFGSELILGGTARTLTDISFEYYGDFEVHGDEACKVRIYSNETQYDLYRNEPTTVLYESDYFSIKPGYQGVILPKLNIPARDVVTFTVETKGLGASESFGLLLYNPPTVGRSFNELWRRNEGGAWEAVFYQFPTANIKAKLALRILATNTVNLTKARVAKGKFQFGVNGMNGADLIVECSKDFKTWKPVATNSISSSFMPLEQAIAEGDKCFFRIRVDK